MLRRKSCRERANTQRTKLTPKCSKGVCERSKNLLEQTPFRFCNNINEIIAFIRSANTIASLVDHYPLMAHALYLARKLSQHLLQAMVCLFARLANDPTGRRESVQAGNLVCLGPCSESLLRYIYLVSVLALVPQA